MNKKEGLARTQELKERLKEFEERQEKQRQEDRERQEVQRQVDLEQRKIELRELRAEFEHQNQLLHVA